MQRELWVQLTHDTNLVSLRFIFTDPPDFSLVLEEALGPINSAWKYRLSDMPDVRVDGHALGCCRVGVYDVL